MAGSAILETGNPWFVPVDQLQEDVGRDGKELINFANYDYLGVSDHPSIKAAAHQAVDRLGVGALGSRLVGGERLIHAELEDQIANLIGVESCLTLVSGYLTNVTTISHLMGKSDLILYDELSHNSIVSGLSGSRATSIAFRHNDMDELSAFLKEHRTNYRRCLIVVEGLYSMDGDLPNLPALLEIKERHGCWLLVDEAHSIGGLGKTGRGVSEHFGTDPRDIDVIVGTLSKTFASCGGFIGAQRPIIDWLRFTLPGFVFSVGLPPVIAAAAQAALGLFLSEPGRTKTLQLNSEHFLRQAENAGLSTGDAIGRSVVPVLLPDLQTTLACGDYLLSRGIYAPPIVQVGVPKHLPRIRFFLSARHTFEQINETIGVLEEFLASYGANESRRPAPIEKVQLSAAS